VHFIGVDLAWGDRRPTGVAVLDDDGRLVQLAAATDDDSVVAALADSVGGPCVVAFDAPIVVTNATGNRPAEAALNRDFARFHAGAHPTNTARPEFASQPRAARLAERLGLAVVPPTTSPRRAMEVYPHAATVSLFRLGRTLKYKNKPGRPLTQLRSELMRLIGLLEGLAAAEPALRLTQHRGWRDLVTSVETAERKSDLRRAEDQVDAVVCAYVALFAERRPDRVVTYGDAETGAIITPSLPPGHEPDTEQPAEVDQTIRRAVQEYAALQPELREATEQYVELVTSLLDDAGINYLTVTGRAKTVASFAAKAERTDDGAPLYTDPLHQITDQIGLRVITYVRSDVTAVADVLSDQLRVLEDRDMGEVTASEGRFGYASRHLLVELDEARAASAPGLLRARSAQVQVRTVLQHAWAEFEHDIRYKGVVPEEHAPDLDRRFTLAAGLLELADSEFSAIRARLRTSGQGERDVPDDADPRIAAGDLAAFLAAQFADAEWSRTDHYEWISGLLLELGITSLDELAGLLGTIDVAAIDARTDYRYPPGAVRRLDDALLAVFGGRYVSLHGNQHRVALLRARLDRLRGNDSSA
jgi:predicted RNase H-like nuclease